MATINGKYIPDQFLWPAQAQGSNSLTSSPPQQGSSNVATATPTQTNTASSNLGQWLSQHPMPGAGGADAPWNANSIYSPATLDPNALARVQPAYYGGAQVGPTAQYGGAQIGPTALLNPSQIQAITQGNTPDLSPQATIQQILQGFQPEATQQQGQLNQQLAAAGLSGGPALAAQQQLATRQTQALAPAIAQAIQQSQQNQLQAGEFGSNALIQALTGNVGALNTAAQQQAGLTQQAGLANQSALNSAKQLQAQLAQQAGLANADAANTANTANVGAWNTTLASNVAAQNAARQAYLQQLQQQWLDQFSAFNSINDAALGAQNNIAVQGAENFGAPTGSSDAYAGLGTALGGIYAPTTRTAPTAAK